MPLPFRPAAILVSLLVLVLLATGAPSGNGAQAGQYLSGSGSAIKGDTNCDGVVDAQDILPYLEFWGGLDDRPEPCGLGLSGAAAPEGGFGQWFDASRSTGYIEIPYNPALNPADEITIEAWYNPYSYETPMFYAGACLSLVGNGYVSAYWLGVCNGRVRFYTRGSGSSHDSSAQLPLRQWSHIAVTSDATKMRIYIDGDLDSEFDVAGPLTQNTNPVQIGADPDYNVRPWAAMNEVRIWNVARTEAEIESLMFLPAEPPIAGLVAAYHLVGDATDATGNYNGAPSGNVVYGPPLPPIQTPDINCDGRVNIDDVLPFLYDQAGIDPALPPGCEPLETVLPCTVPCPDRASISVPTR